MIVLAGATGESRTRSFSGVLIGENGFTESNRRGEGLIMLELLSIRVDRSST